MHARSTKNHHHRDRVICQEEEEGQHRPREYRITKDEIALGAGFSSLHNDDLLCIYAIHNSIDEHA